MSLQEWLRANSGSLQRSSAAPEEIRDHLLAAKQGIKDAEVEKLSTDGKLILAYGAALRLCQAALHAEGYRVTAKEGGHRVAIDSLTVTLGQEELAEDLQQARQDRNVARYEGFMVCEESDVEDLICKTKYLLADVLEWLKANHQLLAPSDFEVD